jgi:hypothetical protein
MKKSMNTHSNLDAFGGFEHDDLTGNFGAPHVFCGQVIHAHTAQPPDTNCSPFFDQRGCAFNDVCIICARFRRVHDNRVRAGEVLQMEPHGVLWRLFNKRVILCLVCANPDGIVAVENLGIHVYGIGL